MNNFGKNIRINIFGESHGPYIGLTIDGFPPNFTFDLDDIKKALEFRKGIKEISTPRREKDEFQIISGYFNNHTTNEPLTILIKNTDINSSDYKEGYIRPSHSDLTKYIKTNGANDYRGGGASSGRMTVALVILGQMCKQILSTKPVKVISRIASIKTINDIKIDYQNIDSIKKASLETSSFPVIDERAKKSMFDLIKKTKQQNNSLGGIIETFIFNITPGLGEPFFDSFESYISHLLFSIPGVKGIEFGDGFQMTTKYGTETIDEIKYQENDITFNSNHQGGINGGITNGNYVNFRVAIKPPVSIKKEINTINIKTKENITLLTEGRHDPTFIHRTISVINALCYYAILDMEIENER